jgi:hypothetical protein
LALLKCAFDDGLSSELVETIGFTEEYEKEDLPLIVEAATRVSFLYVESPLVGVFEKEALDERKEAYSLEVGMGFSVARLDPEVGEIVHIVSGAAGAVNEGVSESG